MKITICAAEAVPFVKVGGLGDVIGALPLEFVKAGHEVIQIIPAYSAIDKSKFNLRKVPEAQNLTVTLGEKKVSFNLLEHIHENNKGLRLFFIEKDYYFARETIYSHAHNKSFEDEGELWLFFQMAAIQSMIALNFQPDVLHVHDFHTALLPALIRYHYKEFFQNTRSLLTLHNLLFQGVFSFETYEMTGIPLSEFYPMSDFEYYGKTNFVKSGLIYADAVNTVSEHYAEELLNSSAYSYGLYDILNQNKHKFSGILNGADYRYWNPEKDQNIEYNYGPDSLDIKSQNRDVLIKKSGLKVRKNTLVLGIVARMTKQKGFQLLLDAMDEMMKRDIVLTILASGDELLEKRWEKQQQYYPDRIFFEKEYNEAFSHEIQAGCDLFLMPSLFEPCGLSQMYAMKYGTPPLAYATGGLADTITDKGSDKTGFLFTNYQVDDFLKALDDAINQFNYPYWSEIQLNGMKKDFSWQLSAGKYLVLFDKITQHKG